MTDRATASTHLNYRVAGVCINDGHVLLAGRLLGHARWPPRLLESSWDALLREMDEQIATRVTILRLLWIVENFYVHVAVRFHEISFYYQMALPDDSPFRVVRTDFTGREGDVTLLFHWFRIDELERIRLHPTFLRTALAALPDSPVHFIHVDQLDQPEV